MSIVASVYGRAGKDGELRQSSSGKSWTRLSIVCQAGQTREGEPVDVWLQLTAFGPKAEGLAKITKGSMVGAIGRLELSRWTDKEGNARESWSLIVDELLTSRSARPGGKAKTTGKAEKAAPRPDAVPDFNDDIPF